MSVSLQRRRVGEVNVITCTGKIVGGPEEAELQTLVDGLLPLEPHESFEKQEEGWLVFWSQI